MISQRLSSLLIYSVLLVSLQTSTYAWTWGHETPPQEAFFEACSEGNLEQICTLLAMGVSLDAINEEGHNALLLATKNGHLEAIKLLVAHGAQVTQSDKNNDTPLKYAAFNGHLPLVRYFIEQGVPLDQKDLSTGRTALLDALLKNNKDCAQELIQHGANITLADKQGLTPLILATLYNMLDIVQLLVEKGAPINAYDKSGNNALTYAYDNDYHEIIAYLEGQGAQISLTTPVTMRRRLETLPMDENTRALIYQKIAQFERAQGTPNNPQGNPYDAEKLRSQLHFLFNIPWGVISPTPCDLAHAQAVLDIDHAHMQLVKDEILDFIALQMAQQQKHAPILCLVGPPGVGKTSLATALAKALGRTFERVGLGGVNDASIIRGNQRVYMGSDPGLFTKALIHAKTMNPVILVDEIDKMQPNNWHGDPYAALLELFDPEQNASFRDENLEIPLDFSQVIFVATANSLDSIPRPLLDRMKVIRLSSYTTPEKLTIVEQHLIKKIAAECGLQPDDLPFSREVLTYLMKHYTSEAGVRNIERIIRTLCAKAVRAKLEKKPFELTQDTLFKILGPAHKVSADAISHEPRVGVATGLYWSSVGGGTLSIETVVIPGTGKLILTGQLGDVMKESAQAAVSYARAHAHELGINNNVFATHDIHIHVPEGATPKDGPSAGVGIATSVVSALTKRPVRGDLAMTGEITLALGSVEQIGGFKEKALAAQEAGYTHICAPDDNRFDLIREPEVINGVTIHWVKTIDEVLKLALLPAAQESNWYRNYLAKAHSLVKRVLRRA